MGLHMDFAPRLMPAPQAAHYLGVSVSTLLKLPIQRKELGGKRLYDRYDLDAYANELSTETERGDNTCDEVFG